MITLSIIQFNPVVGDILGNASKIGAQIQANASSDCIIFPELALCGYPPEDLVQNVDLLKICNEALEDVVRCTKGENASVILGAPLFDEGRLFNSIFVIRNGIILETYNKTHLPNYGVFDEKRVFDEGGGAPCVISIGSYKFGLAICEDIWFSEIPRALKIAGADAIISINASPWRKSVDTERQNSFNKWSDVHLPHLFVNQVGGQDSLVFDGASFFKNPSGQVQQIGKSFEESIRVLEYSEDGGFKRTDFEKEFTPLRFSQAEEMYSACVLGLRDYVNKNGFKGVLIGLSGGIDSAICAAMAVDALGANRVRVIMMPYAYTSSTSQADAKMCADRLGIQYQTLPIFDAKAGIDAVLSSQKTVGDWALADENIQSRIRGLLLMAMSNASGSMVVTTGNKSEMAVGYATLYGDMCGGYNPIKDLWKTEIFALASWRNSVAPTIGLGPAGEVIPQNIISKPPSAELRADQKDSDSLPEYDILDDVLMCLVEKNMPVQDILKRGHDANTVKRIEGLLRRSEYKRRQSAPGPKISSVAFDKDWRYPITNAFRLHVDAYS